MVLFKRLVLFETELHYPGASERSQWASRTRYDDINSILLCANLTCVEARKRREASFVIKPGSFCLKVGVPVLL